MSRQKGLNGTVAAVLAYLDNGPQSGWDIANGLRDLVGDFWNITPSQIYRELRTMTATGLVQPGETEARDRRPYSITDTGRAALRAWLAQPLEPDIVRIPLLLRLFLAFTTTDPDPLQITALLEHYRTVHREQLHGYATKLAELDAAGLPQAHLVRYGLLHEQAVLEWLDSLPWQP